MKDQKEAKNTSKLFIAGLILGLVELCILFISYKQRGPSTDFLGDAGPFFINYIFTLAYSAIVIGSSRPFFRFLRIEKRLIINILCLFSISAFTLNHSMELFAKYSTWVVYYLFMFYVSFLGLSFYHKLPSWLQNINLFFLGAGFWMILYFAIYLAPIYPFGIPGFILLGISMHLYIPMLICIAVILVFFRMKKTLLNKVVFFTGLLIPLVISAVFLNNWSTLKKDIHTAGASTIMRPDNPLPEWILLCQEISDDPFTQKIVEGNLVYDTFKNMWGGFNTGSFDEVKRHDPLINMGMAVLGDINLDNNTRVKILKSQHDARHLTQRKLWSGRNIGTITVLNNTRVYPEYRMAYTEKIITVKNYSSWERNQQEAAFTFHLPEGSVATSLSLWIDGKEEPSRLSSKSKADSAYVSIVGVERRDPALLHWQEGNTLTLTVFPCTPAENRKFKIGITTPLKEHNGILNLQSIWFEGPDFSTAMETSVVEFVSDNPVNNIHVPEEYKNETGMRFVYSGDYKPWWEMEFTAPAISAKSFSFNGYSFKMEALEPVLGTFDPQSIYLDLNKSWTKEEFEKVWYLIKKKKVYVFHDKLIKLNEDNRQALFNTFTRKNFSLFPFYLIREPEQSLVISKSARLSPNLADLEGSGFITKLTNGLAKSKSRIPFFQLGNESSPYLNTLKELQVFNFYKGRISELSNFIQNKKFVQTSTDPNVVDLDISNTRIVRSDAHKKSEAPDHLMRLFAYNKIMKQLGRNYFSTDQEYIASLVKIANEAYVVSPVSSLIVLEAIKDYDRFGIEENKNSLKNASVKSSGAVPEPSEWILIGIMAVIIIVLFGKKIRF